jgi:hypothetical protein
MTTTKTDSEATRLLQRIESDGRHAEAFLMNGDAAGGASQLATVLRGVADLRRRLEQLGIV